MPTFSFDIVSEIDKAEMNNVFTQAEKEIATRYDFRGTAAAVEWLEDKKEFKLTGDSEWQIDAVLDIVRKKLAAREQSSKILDLTKEKVVANLKTTWEIPFKAGLAQDIAKKMTPAQIEDAERRVREFKAAHPFRIPPLPAPDAGVPHGGNS